MSLTNDMLQLKQTADKICNTTQVSSWINDKSAKESYYKIRSAQQKQVLYEYDFQTPMELRSSLQSLWNTPDKVHMSEFIPVCMVASSKCRPAKDNSNDEHNISPYIYVF